MTELVLNGIDGTTGAYLSPAPTMEQIAAVARGEPVPEVFADLKQRSDLNLHLALGLPFGIDPDDLGQTGWGVIFLTGDASKLETCLAPLLSLRRDQAQERYKCFRGPTGWREGEKAHQWLARNGAGPGPAQVRKVPYYLLIVGGPERIPFGFQFGLSINYAVGRIAFETEQEYRDYAQNVVLADNARRKPRKACFFGVRNPEDLATKLSLANLVTPLADELEAEAGPDPDWRFERFLADDATKAELSAQLHAPTPPALLFTASHGMGFPAGHPQQAEDQGALLCQDWPGPLRHRKPIPRDFYFSASDVRDDADLSGTIAFHFACYSAGTPREDDFAHAAGQRKVIADPAFVARLPQRMLGKPGGALAVIGHVERAWGYSFMWPGLSQHIVAFQSCLSAVMHGRRVGAAMDSFASTHADLSVRLVGELEDIRFGATSDDTGVAGLWTANNDAKNYIVIGDPAVRLHDGTH